MGRVTHVNTRFGNILSYDGAGSDNDTITDGHRQNARIRPDADMIAKPRSPPEIPIFSGRASGTKQIVNEHRSMRDKAIIPDRDELTDKRMRLNSTPLANLYAFLYLNKRPNKGFISKHAPVKVDWLNDNNVFPERYSNNSGVPNFWLAHKRLV